MTRAVLERVKTWPAERQAYAAHLLLEIEQDGDPVFELTDEDRAAIDESIRQADRGEFATDEEMAAIFNKHRGYCASSSRHRPHESWTRSATTSRNAVLPPPRP